MPPRVARQDLVTANPLAKAQAAGAMRIAPAE